MINIFVISNYLAMVRYQLTEIFTETQKEENQLGVVGTVKSGKQ